MLQHKNIANSNKCTIGALRRPDSGVLVVFGLRSITEKLSKKCVFVCRKCTEASPLFQLRDRPLATNFLHTPARLSGAFWFPIRTCSNKVFCALQDSSFLRGWGYHICTTDAYTLRRDQLCKGMSMCTMLPDSTVNKTPLSLSLLFYIQ